MSEAFGRYHPVVNMIFYGIVLGITMFYMHPIFLGISFFCAGSYLMITHRKNKIKLFVIMMGTFLCTSIINPLFSHRGGTLLFYLPTGNPVTLESIIYGMAAALTFVTTMMWFITLQKIVTSDKIMAVFGNIIPSIALIFSMVLKFVPNYVKHAKDTAFVNEVLSNSKEKQQTKFHQQMEKIRVQMRNFSITSTWALENSVDTADSMASRGYGTGRRTNFHNYQLEGRDIMILVWIIGLGIAVVSGILSGQVKNGFYPFFYIEKEKYSMSVYVVYAMLCVTPVLINLWEELRWLRLKSKI